MPIEIRELHIRVTVDETTSDAGEEVHFTTSPNPLSAFEPLIEPERVYLGALSTIDSAPLVDSPFDGDGIMDFGLDGGLF